MREWYSIHVHNNLRMGFIPFTGSSKSAPIISTTTPSIPLVDVTPTNVGTLIFGLDVTFFWVFFTGLFLLTFCCTFCIIYCFFGMVVFSQ